MKHYLKQIKTQNLSNQAKWDDNENGTFSLLEGSAIAPLSNSAREKTKQMRESVAPNGIVQTTTIFNNLSALASVVMGSNTSGAWFLKASKLINDTNGARSMEKETTQTAQENAQTIAPKETIKETKTNAPRVNKNELSAEFINKSAMLYETMQNFFKECEWVVDGTPLLSPRVLNNFMNSKSLKDAQNVFVNYCLLTGAPSDFISRLKSLLNSAEFKQINETKNELTKEHAPKQMNKRLYIYFGGAGTGKTTRAVLENPSATIMSASPSQDPETLLGVFDMDTKTFKPSALANAMQNGETIIIDEILLYSDEVLTMLQAICDEKTSIYDRQTKQTFNIKDGFKIVATMNLTRAMPSALITRANLYNFDEENAPTPKQIMKWQF